MIHLSHSETNLNALQPIEANTDRELGADTAQQQQFSELLPLVVAQAMKSSKWITLIGVSREQIEQLAEAGVSRARIRWIQGKNHDQREWATEQALLAGTSGVVISCLAPVQPRTQQRFKMASRMSDTHSFIFTTSTLPTPLH